MKIKFFIIAIVLILNSACARLVSNKDNEDGGFLDEKTESNAKLNTTDIQVIKDLHYSTNQKNTLDVYLPKKMPQHKLPIIFMVHGGAWMIGDKAHPTVYVNKANYFVSKGFIFISINYQLSFNPNPLLQLKDVENAFEYVQKNSKEWNGDPSKILLIGHSAGAHLIGMMNTDSNFKEHKWIGSILLDSAALDLVSIMENKHYRFYDRVFGKNKENWINNSPYHRMSNKLNPMLLVCSSMRDNSCSQSQQFANKALQLKSSIEVISVNLSHQEINALMGGDNAYTEQINSILTKWGL